ncbi:peptidoglycan/LPS O-acetylase OafA/YrhL [Altererythrobacter atlanticus]|uniref:Acyltransferase family protein n=1 Tax=Croceibacterium atlanticum TaxID=1267766 RepID=A0A0F7KTB9_9SPHN|nr:acyltransferase [Croceibacterium atlanticum]AKH42849.1 Acyltransferase family protein [Croceibacterium atlanticum]MBB5731629.1 peptidoglycan/LPS O-acetylase OafA/YrhL [Croceibacterium atlanticum]
MASTITQPIRIEKPQSTVKREFNAATHGLRGLASLAVFWAHLLGGTAEHIYDDNAAYVHLVHAPWCLGSWGVQLFFAISGFVILPSIRRYTLGQFALRRFLRLYPLFFAFSALFIILNALTNEYPGTNNPTAVLAGLTFLNLFTGTEQLTPNAWSLTYEVMFYTLAAVGYYVAYTRKSRIGTIAVAVLSAAFLFRYPIAAFFAGGVIVRLIYEEDLRLSDRASRFFEVAFGLACILLASSRHYDFSQADMADPRSWALIVCTTLYFNFAVQSGSLTTMAAQSRVLVYLGTISYSLYLVHPYTYYAFRTLFDRMDLFTENWLVSMAFFFAVTTPVTIAITHVVHRVLEVGPYQWFFHQRIYRKNKAA